MKGNTPAKETGLRAMAHKTHTTSAHNSAGTVQAKQNGSAAPDAGADNPLQKKENRTGLPDNLKAGIETLSGYSMNDVQVHYNSPRPAAVQAHAYAQGTQIHIAPGRERHLPHEAWHVVQQKQGRVKPTLQTKSRVNINDDAGLEKEADIQGAKAIQLQPYTPVRISPPQNGTHAPVVQRTLNDAVAKAQELGLPHLTSRAEIVAYLKAQPKPQPNQGFDVIRTEYNKNNMNQDDRIAYLDTWPEEEATEAVQAKQWVTAFLANKNIKTIAESNGLGEVAATIRRVGGSRAGSGMDMLNKFAFYSLHGIEIITHLLQNYSADYKNALNEALSSQLNQYGNAVVSDEIFKEIPPDADPNVIREMDATSFMEPLYAGYKRLQESIDAGYDMEIIVHYYFLHDKGYLNASAPLTQTKAAQYKARIDQFKAQGNGTGLDSDKKMPTK